MRTGSYSPADLEDAFHQRTGGTYIGDFIFGANDGIVTTFAVVTGSVGARASYPRSDRTDMRQLIDATKGNRQ